MFPKSTPEAVELTDNFVHLLIQRLRRGLFSVYWGCVYARDVDSIDIVHRRRVKRRTELLIQPIARGYQHNRSPTPRAWTVPPCRSRPHRTVHMKLLQPGTRPRNL